MAATNATLVETKVKAPFNFTTLIEMAVHVFDVTVAALVGLKTVATHNLITIPVGKALVGATVIVQEACTSDGSATVQFKIGSETLTAAIPVASLGVGAVIKLEFNTYSGTGTVADTAATITAIDVSGGTTSYIAATADTLDMAVGTAALTAGKFVLIPEFIDVSAILNRG